MPEKINQQGDFLYYPGITIISMLNITSSETSISPWQALYDFLSSHNIVQKYYSLLPLDSYHMTTNSLYNKGSMTAGEWEQFVKDNAPFFKTVNKLLNNGTFLPKVRLLNHNVNTRNAIQLILEIPRKDYQNILGISKTLGMQKGLPNPLHITLAYQKMDVLLEIQQQLKNQLETKIQELFSESTLQLQPPTLCTFKKMGEFRPWDGRYSPSLFSNHMPEPYLPPSTSPAKELDLVPPLTPEQENAPSACTDISPVSITERYSSNMGKVPSLESSLAQEEQKTFTANFFKRPYTTLNPHKTRSTGHVDDAPETSSDAHQSQKQRT